MTEKDKVKISLVKYYNDHDKKFPTLNYLSFATKIPVNKVKEYLIEFKKEGLISKYETNWYVKKEFADSMRQRKEIIQPIVKQAKDGIKVIASKMKDLKFNIAWFIQGMCLIIAGVSIYVTSSLSFEWAQIMFSDPGKAAVLAITIPLFSTFSIEGAILLFNEGNVVAVIASVILILMMLFAMIFDSSMIILSQYNKRYTQIETTNKVQATSNKEETKYDLLKKQQVDQEKVIKETEIKRDGEKEKLKLFEINTKEYYTQNWYLTVAENKLTEERNKLKKIEDQLFAQVDKTDISVMQSEDGYTKLAKQFGWKVNDVEFIVFSVLAVFLVIVAPFSAFVALGMWRNKK